MTKAKITFLIEVEYEMVTEHYEPNSTPQQMLEVDLANANDDPYIMIGDDAEWTITGELIEQIK